MTIHLPGQHAILALSGPELTPEEAAFLAQWQPAGLIFFSRNIRSLESLQTLIGQIHASAPYGPTLWIDQEGGRVQRLRDPLTRYPSPYRLALLAHHDLQRARHLARAMGRLTGLELACLGIGVDCAPVLDIQEEGADPVIGERAFGATPEAVIDLAGAWLDGFLPTGVMAMGKHFPGHGAARADSHKSLPLIDKPRAALDAWELRPFHALLPRLPCLMTAHLIATGLDATQPATWSVPTLVTLLREHWNYDGLLASDAIEMGALSGNLTSRAHQAIQAGCDLVLCCTGRLEDNLSTLSGIATALELIAPEQRGQSQTRIQRMMERHRPQPGDLAALLATADYRQLRSELEHLAEERLAHDPTEAPIS